LLQLTGTAKHVLCSIERHIEATQDYHINRQANMHMAPQLHLAGWPALLPSTADSLETVAATCRNQLATRIAGSAFKL